MASPKQIKKFVAAKPFSLKALAIGYAIGAVVRALSMKKETDDGTR